MDLPTLSNVTLNKPIMEPVDHNVVVDEDPVPEKYDSALNEKRLDRSDITAKHISQIIDNDKDLKYDGCAVRNGYASITPIHLKMTNMKLINELERSMIQ